jgi:hypothetical protein
MEQLMALGVKPRDQDSATKILVVLKSELAKEKAAWEKVQAKAGTLAWTVEDLKKMTDRFAVQIPFLDEKVKHLDNKVLDAQSELWAKELCLEWTTKANNDYMS